MDTLTHALSGALAARATAPANARISLTARVTAGFFVAAFPDMDWVLAYVSPVAYLTGHRGVTHSVLLLPLWAGLLAWLCAKIGRGGATWRDYYGVCAIALGMHILGDLITSFGTIVLAPVSDARVAWSTTFIIDLWFTGIVVAGLAAAWIWRRSRVPAALGLAALAGYVGMQAVLHSRAVEIGADYARRQGLDAVRVSALPRPVSPFNWMIVITEKDRYRFANVNLLRERIPPAPRSDAGLIERLDAAYAPVGDAPWTTVAKFGESPAQRILASAVWFEDLRFNTPGREGNPFRFGVCDQDGSQDWTAFRLRDDGTREPAR